MTQRKFTAAVVQAAAPAFDKKAALEKFADLAGQAAGKGADIAVFPEAFIGGYPKGLDFGARVGSRPPEGHAAFLRYGTAPLPPAVGGRGAGDAGGGGAVATASGGAAAVRPMPLINKGGKGIRQPRKRRLFSRGGKRLWATGTRIFLPRHV